MRGRIDRIISLGNGDEWRERKTEFRRRREQQFEHLIRFRAIENRIPLLFVSQNGRTVLFNALGEPAAEPLAAFTAGALVAVVPLGNVEALFTRIGRAFDRTVGGLALLILAGILWRRWRK